MVGCQALPELNGDLVFTDAHADFPQHTRPTYTREDGALFVYSWMDEEDETQSCWCIGRELGSGKILGYHSDTPFFLASDDRLEVHVARFPGSLSKMQEVSSQVIQTLS